jgi:hypothetical protein
MASLPASLAAQVKPLPQDPGRVFDPVRAKPLPAEAKDDQLRKLLKDRYNEALGEVKDLYEVIRAGKAIALLLPPASQRLTHADLELSDKPADKVVVLRRYLNLTKASEKLFQVKFEIGTSPILDLCRARYYRIDAEIQLLRALPEDKKAAFVPTATKPLDDELDDKVPAILKPRPIDAKDDPLRRLLKERHNEAAMERRYLNVLIEAGKATLPSLVEARQRLLYSALELIDKPTDMEAFCSVSAQVAHGVS